MRQFPISEKRRRRLEALIRVFDMVVYLAIFAGGIYAVVATPASVSTELAGAEWLVIFVWGPLLLIGGAVGFTGRLTRYWMAEAPGTVAAFFGVLIYLVIVGKFAFSSISASVAAVLVLVALINTARRYVELQLFGEEPGIDDFKHRVAAMIRRRTENAIEHH